QKAQAAGVAPVGFANPVLYGIAKSPTLYAACFNDVADGTKNPPQPGALGISTPPDGFPTVAGYDLVTGLGSPTCALIDQLASPTPTAPVPPPPPPPPTVVVAPSLIGIGNDDSCGIVDGAVECWGLNQKGEEGSGNTNQALAPVCGLEAVTNAAAA